MTRLVGVDSPRKKHVEIALTYIYGIGRARARETLESTGISPDTRVKGLTEDGLTELCDFIRTSYKAKGDLHREVATDIHRKTEINCYQGRRHHAGLPVHGQRTKTNTRTRKRLKRTVASKEKAK